MKTLTEQIIDGYNVVETGITTEEWIEILQDENVTRQTYKDVLLKIYNEPNHKSTCKNLSDKYGGNSQSYNSLITHFARVVQKKLNRFRVINVNGKESFCSIVMIGKEVGSNFEWTIKPELIEAIEKSGILSYDPIQEMIDRYKEHVKNGGLKNELYKWELVQKHLGHPDINAVDFGEEIKSIELSNLVYQMTKTVVIQIADKEPEAYRLAFKGLFDEQVSLSGRVKFFMEKVKEIYKSMGETLQPHHNEREIATFLTYHNPEKYTFYMPKFYKPYCQLLGIKEAKTGNRYEHYLQLIDDLIDNYIKNDAELLELVESKIDSEIYYPDKNRKILAQDILYQMLSLDPKRNNEPIEEEIIEVEEENKQKNMKLQPLNQILYGPPGTGKTYNTINKALEIINPGFTIGKSRQEIKQEYNRLVEQGQIVFTTFHQSMNYEDFVEGIKPQKPNEDDGFLKYDIEPGIFKKICIAAQTPNQQDFNTAYNQFIKDLEDIEKIQLKTQTGRSFAVGLNSNNNLTLYTGSQEKWNGSLTKESLQTYLRNEDEIKYWRGYYGGVAEHLKDKYKYSSKAEREKQNFVLIIDEINRGNISQIFGELITLIEEDKRLGNSEALEITLPYSKEKFGVPSNLYIIGTMNTADRSVEALDTALRRRFSFTEMTPKSAVITEVGKAENGVVEGINLADLLDVINERIEILLDRDHQIGHSYFLSVTDLETLKVAFQNKIIPLLQEYFFGDYGKIGLTLGRGFIKMEKYEDNAKFFANFQEGYSYDDYLERPVYSIQNPIEMNDEEFLEALNLLINE